jgi:16S rRNA G1207 methylase RsmC
MVANEPSNGIAQGITRDISQDITYGIKQDYAMIDQHTRADALTASGQHASVRNNEKAQQEQYFSAEPSSADIRHTIRVILQGHPVDMQVSHGVFSMNRLDLGTSVLLRHVPQPAQNGNLLDLGCGWGPIAVSMGFASPQADIWAVDSNERALELTRDNARAQGLDNITAINGEDVPDDVRFATIWSNPPIRIGKEALHALLMQWLPKLAVSGSAYLVVQKNLGADSLIPWLSGTLGKDYSVRKYASSKGYRVIEVSRTA